MRSIGRHPIVLCILMLYWYPAHAYLDPGTGSAIIQGLIATIAALGATFRIYRYRIQAYFGKKKSDDVQSEAVDSKEA
jgi:hypothetical protein